MKRKKLLTWLIVLAIGVSLLLSANVWADDMASEDSSSVEQEATEKDLQAYATGDDYPSNLKSAALDAVVDQWNFYNRECTSFVAWCLNSRNEIGFTNWYGGVRWGNANNWGNAARSLGITVDNTPAVGAVAWWNSGTYGHVAWVREVSGNNVFIDEYNYNYNGNYHTRNISSNPPSGYIHIKDITSNVEDTNIIDQGYCGGEGDGRNIKWTLDRDGVLLIEGSGKMKDWGTAHNYISTVRKQDWHPYYLDIKKIKVENGIINIGGFAFWDCRNLSGINLPDSITSIGCSAFEHCISLSGISLPHSLTSIGYAAFKGCISLNSIRLPNSLTNTGDSTFEDCSRLSSISLPDSLTIIGNTAFRSCISRSSIDLPTSLITIGDLAFFGCSSLSSINLPNSVTSIGAGAFNECSSLRSINLPDSLTVIGDSAFSGCSSLSSISLPDSLTFIGNAAFWGCSSLSSISLPSLVTSIEYGTFFECINLNSIYIPSSVNKISNSVFWNTHIKNIYYGGTEEQWNNIEIVTWENIHDCYDGLLNATIHYNSHMPSSDEPSLDDCLINATSYNKDLAVYAANLSQRVYDDEGASDQGVRNYLMYDHGFSEGISKFYSNNYGAKFIFNWGSLAFTLATRKYNGPGADGNTDILVIVAQGSTNPYELYNDAYSEPDYEKMQDFGGHAPYGIVEDFYNAIVEGLPNVVESGKKYKVLVTGHSLGGAAANLVAANLSDGRVKGVRTSREDVFCYTFGAINSIWPNSLVQNNYENIHNVYNLYDTFSPLQYGYIMDNGAGGGFGKFGRMHLFLMDYRTQEQYNQGWLEPGGGYNIRQLRDCVNHLMGKYLNYVERVREGTTGFITREALDAVPSLEESLPYLSLIFCPVDVDVYRGNELVGRVTNNVVDTAVTTIDIRVEGDAKIIIYPDDQKYELRISAFDEGRMTYGQIDLRESSGIKVIKDIVLTQEKTFSSTVGGNVDVEDVKLFVTDTSGEKIYEVLDDGTEVEVEAEPDTNDKLEDFVVRLYRNFLKREPDENGLTDWVDALHSGRGTGAKVVSGFVLSPEYKANSLSNEEYVTALYRIIFGREPDDAGLNSWVAVMENGCTNKKVLSGFINSNEFDDLCQDLGIVKGSYYSDEVADQNVKVAAFVARLYKICLGRAYEQEGLNNWVSALVSNTSTGSSVVRGFFKSQEFENRKLDDNAFVTVAYCTILGREPDAAGLNDWTKALEKGHARETIIRGFLNSEEFGNLCEEYGITR